MSRKIDATAKEMEEKYDAATAALFKERWDLSLGFDQQSRDLQKFREQLQKSNSDLARFDEYLRRTGNTSEYAAQQLRGMADSLIDQQIARLDPVQKQRLIDELEKLGGTAGGQYAKALAERLKGGTKKAAEEAVEIAKTVLSNADLSNIVDSVIRKGQQARQRSSSRAGPFDRKAMEETRANLDAVADSAGYVTEMIDGFSVRIHKSLFLRIAQGSKMAEQEMKSQIEAQVNAEKELAAQRERMAREEEERQRKAELDPKASMGQIEAFREVWSTVSGEEFGIKFGTEFGAGLNGQLAATQVQPPQMDWALMVQNVQAQLPPILNQALSQVRVSLPAPDLGQFTVGLQAALTAQLAPITASVSDAFSSINLLSVGNDLGRSLTEGIRAGIDLDNLASGLGQKIYEKVSAQFKRELGAT